jgi:hypothetical protein
MSATFNVWHPVIDEDRSGCAFDVTTASHNQLADGTLDLMQKLLSAANVDAFVKSWTISPFCSPFYSDYPEDQHWAVRNTMGWRVHITFPHPYRYPSVGFRYLYGDTSEVDPTDPHVIPDNSWAYSSRQGVAIGAFAEKTREEVEELCTRAELGAHQVMELTPDLLIVRADVGMLQFPAEEPRLQATVEKLS